MEEKYFIVPRPPSRSEEQKKKLLNRLKRIEGQVRGLQTMIENDAYYSLVLIQSSAVSAAMNGFNGNFWLHIFTVVWYGISGMARMK